MPKIRIGKPASVQRVGKPEANIVIGRRPVARPPRAPDVAASQSGAISRCPTCVRVVG